MIIKTEEEIELIRESCSIVSKTLAALAGIIKPGITSLQIDKIADEFIRDHKAVPSFHNYMGFPFNLCASVNEQVVHGFPSDRILEEGDVLSIDLGVYKNGFHSDQAYTFLIGDADRKIVELVKITKEALDKGIEKAVHGNRTGDIGNAIQEYISPFGYGIVRDFAGHGLGTSLHEAPEIPNYGRKGQGKVLKENLVIAIEPMVNLGTSNVVLASDQWTVLSEDSSISVHFEQDILVRKGVPEILTDFTIIEAAERANPNLHSST